MKRALALLVVLALALTFTPTAKADGRRVVVKDASGHAIAVLVVCRTENGPTATLVNRAGVICGPSALHRIRGGGFAFACNGNRFVFGCLDGGCRWRMGGRHGTLCPTRG